MVRLKKSEALGREIRQDDPKDLAIPTWTLVREAIESGNKEEALDFLEYGCAEAEALHDMVVSGRNEAATYIARFLGEEELPKFWRQAAYDNVKKWVEMTPGTEENLQRFTELHRGHFSKITIEEEPDRYIVRYDPCGSGGRLLRTRNVARVQKAYPWSWSMSGIAYYCTHCCMQREIIPTEICGYPLTVTFPPEKPEDPCIHLCYKKPELIPEEYFTRIGKTKTIK